MNAVERGIARNALRQYPKINARRAEARITPDYGGVVVQHGASRTTENVALSTALTAEEERIVAAVEFALSMMGASYNAAERLKMVQLCYFERRSKRRSLEYAAEAVGYSIGTVQKWNLELLTAVYVGLMRR